MYELLYFSFFMVIVAIGLLPAMLFSYVGTTLTLMVVAVIYASIYYRHRVTFNLPRTISLIVSSLVMLILMGYYGYGIQAAGPDAQDAIAYSYYGGLSVIMGVAAYFVMRILIRLAQKIASFAKQSR